MTCACGCGERPLPKRKYVKGHRPIKPTVSGYRRIWVGKDHPLASTDGNAFEHRIVLFNAGVEIPAGYDVHHLNGDRLDNRLENLTVLPRAEHARYHAHDRGWISNQHGTFPVLTDPEARRARVNGVQRFPPRVPQGMEAPPAPREWGTARACGLS